MQRRLLVKADGQVPITSHVARIDQKVTGAVHRLETHLLPLALDEEHVLAIVLPVARCLPQRLVEDDRRLHFDVARRYEDAAHVVGERVPQHRALRQPERRTRGPLVEHEQAEILADLSVVPLLRFLEPLKMGLQLGLAEKRRAVDPLHRLVVRVALPVGARRRQQLERLEAAGRGHVRADAEVDEGVAIFAIFFLDRVDGHLGLSGGLLFDQLHLERFALRGEEPLRLISGPHLTLVDQILRRQVLHLLLDGWEIVRDKRAIDDEVVEESFIGRRTDAALRTGEQLRHGRRQQVSGAVPVEGQRLGVPVGDDRQAHVAVQWRRQIDEPAIDGGCERRLREPRRHLCRHVAGSTAHAHATAGSVG